MSVKFCRECGGNDLKWHVTARGPSYVQDGRIRMSEVVVMAYLACEECGETLAQIEDCEIEELLNEKKHDLACTRKEIEEVVSQEVSRAKGKKS